MLELYIDKSTSYPVSEIEQERTVETEGLKQAIFLRKTWHVNHVARAANSNPTLKLDLIMNFPHVNESRVNEFLNIFNEKEIKVSGPLPDYSVSDNNLSGAQKMWYQQQFIVTELGSPLVTLEPNVEEVVEDFQESRKKGRLILSPAALMAYEFTSFTKDKMYSGVILHTSFISVYDIRRKRGDFNLASMHRGTIQRYYDEQSKKKLAEYRRIMSERWKEANRVG